MVQGWSSIRALNLHTSNVSLSLFLFHSLPCPCARRNGLKFLVIKSFFFFSFFFLGIKKELMTRQNFFLRSNSHCVWGCIVSSIMKLTFRDFWLEIVRSRKIYCCTSNLIWICYSSHLFTRSENFILRLHCKSEFHCFASVYMRFIILRF